MLIEYTFIESGEQHRRCYIALCDEPEETIKSVVEKYWKSHGVDSDAYGSFVFARNHDDECVTLTACAKISSAALEHTLSCAQVAGIKCPMPEVLRIIRDFDKLNFE